MTETHTKIDSWTSTEFPFDTNETMLSKLHEVLPEGYWLAKDYSAEDLIVLFRYDDHVCNYD